MIQSTKMMEKLDSLCQLIWYILSCSIPQIYSSEHLSKDFTDLMHMSNQVPVITLTNSVLKIFFPPRKGAASLKRKAEEAVFPFFCFFCRKTGQLGCKQKHSCRACSFTAYPGSARLLQLRCQTSACCSAMVCKDPKLFN